MTLTINPTTYGSLLAEAVPKVIETEAEYDRALQQAEKLHFNKSLSPEEKALYKLLVFLIETYEERHFPFSESPPHEILQYIMEASCTRQADLVGVIGSSGVVSEIVNGKRAISKSQAKALADRFKVSPSLFI
ncbi:MAG: transcriptional regulator [Alkalinema sp. CAN_BIN05]|nr:transcriptional regulator [Alkalinema sp. CAN_BIN05]